MKKQLLLVPVIALVIGVLAFPFLFEDKHVAQGRRLFSRYCTPCHGTGGRGDGYNAKNLDPHARDLTDKSEAYMAKLSNDEIFEVIQKGGRGVDLAPTMPSWGKYFSEEEIWSIVAYVRTLHRYKGEKIDFTKGYQTTRPRQPPIQEAEFVSLLEAGANENAGRQELIEQGKEIFSDFGCIGCHRIDGEGGRLGPDLSRAGFMLQPQFIYRWVRNPLSWKPHTRMPNLGLDEKEALAVTLYLSTQKAPTPSDQGQATQAGGS